jgi:hypothetical protein
MRRHQQEEEIGGFVPASKVGADLLFGRHLDGL